MSEELTIVRSKIDTGSEYWNERINEYMSRYDPMLLWIAKKIIEDLEQND